MSQTDLQYAARAWRTEVMKEAANREITKMLEAFLPAGFVVKINESEHEVPGFPFAPRYKFRGTVRDGRADGSDAHFTVSGYTRNGCRAKLLATILDWGSFYPLT